MTVCNCLRSICSVLVDTACRKNDNLAMRVVSWNMQKNAAAWPYLTGFLRADFALVQDPPPLPENINGLLIHSAQHTGKQSVLYANGTNGYRLRSTMSLAPGGVIASFCKSGQEDLHLLDVHPWTSVTLESAVEMVQELGRANRFFAKKLPKRVIFAGHLVDAASASHRRQRGFIRSWSRQPDNEFTPLTRVGLRDCANKFAIPLLPTSRNKAVDTFDHKPFFWASKDAYASLQQLNVFLDDQILAFGSCNPIVADFDL